jgi:hypothetical protein
MSSGKHSNRNLRLERYLTPRVSYALAALFLAVAVTCGIALFPNSPHKNLIGAEAQASSTQSIVGQPEEWHHPPVQRPTLVAVHYPYTIVVGKGETLSTLAQKAYNRSDAWTLIYYTNHLKSPTIFLGERLTIVRLVGSPPRPPAPPVAHSSTGPKVSPTPTVPTPQPPTGYTGGGIWDCIAHYESGGDWSIDTGNGYYGGLQFTAQTWAGYGGTAYASEANLATPAEQIAIAEKVQASQGWGAWPVSSVKCGV